jgi:hypothetical protein
MKKFFLCLVMLMSMEQVFAPVLTNPGEEETGIRKALSNFNQQIKLLQMQHSEELESSYTNITVIGRRNEADMSEENLWLESLFRGESFLLKTANTLEELFQMLDAHGTTKEKFFYRENFSCDNYSSTLVFKEIVGSKTAEENQKLTRLIQTTMQSMNVVPQDCLECPTWFYRRCEQFEDLPYYSSVRAVKYLMMADYYSNVDEAEQAFSAVTGIVFAANEFATKLGLAWYYDEDIGVGRYIAIEQADQLFLKKMNVKMEGMLSKIYENLND